MVHRYLCAAARGCKADKATAGRKTAPGVGWAVGWVVVDGPFVAGARGFVDTPARRVKLPPMSASGFNRDLAAGLLCCVAAWGTVVWPSVALAEDAVGRLNLAGYKHREMCTASLVAPDLALTAAHCVTTPADGYLKRLGDMVFVAGWNGDTHTGAARVKAVSVHPEAYAEGRFDLRHDVAVVQLAEPIAPAPLRVGSGTLPGPLTLMGYQRSRPHRLEVTPYCYGEGTGTRTGTGAGALWRIRCRVEQGQSGGPVMTGEGDARRIVAVLVAVTEEDALAVPIDGWVRRQLAQFGAE